MLNVWQRYVTDENGDIIPNPEIEVREESATGDGPLVPLFSDVEGNNSLGNPFTGGSDGFVRFYVAGGRYQIKATKNTSTSTFRYVQLGSTQSIDAGEGVAASYETKAALEAANVPDTVDALYLQGYTSAGDGGGALYKRVGSEPSHAGKIQSADGAWWEIAEPVYNAKAFGSAMDDSTVQNAVDAALSTGVGDVFIPAGTWDFSSEVTYGSDLTIRGAGIGRTIINMTASADAFRSPNNDSGDAAVTDVTIENMELIGNKDTVGYSDPYGPGDVGSAGIRFTNIENGIIRDIYSQDFSAYGAEVKLSQRVSVHNCYFRANGDDGLSISDHRKGGVSETRYVSVSQCYSWGHAADIGTGTGSGFEVDDGPKYVSFSQCFAANNLVGFEIHSHEDETGPEGISYQQCVAFDNNKSGFRSIMFTGASTSPRSVFYNGCYAKDNTESGISISNTLRVLIENCQALGNGEHGFRLNDSNGSAVRGCLAEFNGQTAADTYSNYIVENTAGIDISNNRARYSGGANATGYGLRVTGTSNRYIVSDNDFFEGGNVENFDDDPSASSANRNIHDNIGYVNENIGKTQDVPNASGEITVSHGLDVTPTVVIPASEVSGADRSFHVTDIGASTFTVLVRDGSGSIVTSGTLNFGWWAKA